MTLVLNGTTGVSAVDGTASTPAIQGNDSNTGMFFPAADTIAFATAGTEDMRIDSAGNVGIGTSSPTAKLHVVGNSQVTGSNGIVSLLNGNTAGGMKIGVYTAAGNANGYLAFEGYDREYGRFASNGNLLVGTTSSPSQTGALAVNNEFFIYNMPTTSSSANCVISSGEGNRFYRSTSSLRYKRDVVDNPRGLADLLTLRPVHFKGTSEVDGEKVFAGFIAEEVDAAGLTEYVEYDNQDRPDNVRYPHMVSLLTKAIQEQQALINDLTARIAALEGVQA